MKKPQVNYSLEMVLTPDGAFVLYPTNDQYVAGALREFGEYSPSEVKLLQSIVRPNWTCLDVGANIGTITLGLAKACKRVVAFEPQIMLNRLIAANAALQGLNNVDVMYAAVGDVNCKVNIPTFNYSTLNNYGAIGRKEWGKGLEVDQIRLDDYVDLLNLGEVQLIKVDAEGMEKEVLMGAAGLIGRNKPVMWVENDKPENSDELIRYVKSINYTPYWVVTSVAEPDPPGTHQLGSQASFNMLCVTSGPNFINCTGFDVVMEGDNVESRPYEKMFRYADAGFSS